MDDKSDNIPIPKFPCGSLRYEGDIFSGDVCPKCESSMARKFWFFKIGGCIQPECDNYFKNLD